MKSFRTVIVGQECGTKEENVDLDQRTELWAQTAVRAQRADPWAHFSTNKYLAAYPDVKAANADPLLHYVLYGQEEGRAAFAV